MSNKAVFLTVVLDLDATATPAAARDAVIKELQRTEGKIAAYTDSGSPVKLVSVTVQRCGDGCCTCTRGEGHAPDCSNEVRPL